MDWRPPFQPELCIDPTTQEGGFIPALVHKLTILLLEIAGIMSVPCETERLLLLLSKKINTQERSLMGEVGGKQKLGRLLLHYLQLTVLTQLLVSLSVCSAIQVMHKQPHPFPHLPLLSLCSLLTLCILLIPPLLHVSISPPELQKTRAMTVD